MESVLELTKMHLNIHPFKASLRLEVSLSYMSYNPLGTSNVLHWHSVLNLGQWHHWHGHDMICTVNVLWCTSTVQIYHIHHIHAFREPYTECLNFDILRWSKTNVLQAFYDWYLWSKHIAVTRSSVVLVICPSHPKCHTQKKCHADLGKVIDGTVVRACVSLTWNMLSWSGGHEFEPQSGRTWGAWCFCVSCTWRKKAWFVISRNMGLPLSQMLV